MSNLLNFCSKGTPLHEKECSEYPAIWQEKNFRPPQIGEEDFKKCPKPTKRILLAELLTPDSLLITDLFSFSIPKKAMAGITFRKVKPAIVKPHAISKIYLTSI
jgi:hypothetical protein